MKDDTRTVLLRVLTGNGTDIDKLDVISNLVVEKIAMTESMSSLLEKGSFVAGNTVLTHILSLDQVLSTVTTMSSYKKQTPKHCIIHEGDCVGHN